MKFVRLLLFELLELFERKKVLSSLFEKDLIRQRLLSEGFVLLPRYFDEDFVMEILDELETKGPTIYNWSDDLGSDKRCYQAEKKMPTLERFLCDSLINDNAKWFYGKQRLSSFVLLNRLIPVPGNYGSGGGWHRDSPTRHQFKAILYLTDVTDKTGPFQIIPRSNRKRFILRDAFKLNEAAKYRFTEEEIKEITNFKEYEVKNITGKRGSLLLVDTKSYHRGMPIMDGERIAATIYFFNSKIPKHMIHG